MARPTFATGLKGPIGVDWRRRGLVPVFAAIKVVAERGR